MSFKRDIEKFNEKAEKAALMVFRGTAFDLFRIIIVRTPVKTGRLRGNWMAELNGINPSIKEGRTGQTAINKAKSKTGKARIGDAIYLTNNLPYAGFIENGNSKQAPRGMVKRTIVEYLDHVRKNAQKVKK